MLIDGTWRVIGSTNFDNRSFGTEAREIDYRQWKRRSLFERGPELLGWVLERQQ